MQGHLSLAKKDFDHNKDSIIVKQEAIKEKSFLKNQEILLETRKVAIPKIKSVILREIKDQRIKLSESELSLEIQRINKETELFKKAKLPLTNYIRTSVNSEVNAFREVYYLPKVMNDSQNELLQSQATEVYICIWD